MSSLRRRIGHWIDGQITVGVHRLATLVSHNLYNHHQNHTLLYQSISAKSLLLYTLLSNYLPKSYLSDHHDHYPAIHALFACPLLHHRNHSRVYLHPTEFTSGSLLAKKHPNLGFPNFLSNHLLPLPSHRFRGKLRDQSVEIASQFLPILLHNHVQIHVWRLKSRKII